MLRRPGGSIRRGHCSLLAGEIIGGRRGISADTALRLSRYFGTSAEFWLNLQVAYDLREAEMSNSDSYVRISRSPVVTPAA